MQKRRKFNNFVFALLAGCKPHTDVPLQDSKSIHQLKVMPKDILMRFGEKGSAFAARNPGLVKVKKQPAGLNFYSILWAKEKRGNIVIDNGNNSLRISNALSLLSSEDTESKEISNSFQNVDIGAGISKDGLITHDKARISFYGFLQEAKSLGWRSIFYESDPRIFGKERFDYPMNRDRTIGLDGAYMPTLDEWMHIEDMTEWRMYANRIFMSLSFQRDRGQPNAKECGTYLLTFNFKTELEHFRGSSGSDKRKDWKTDLPETSAKSARQRAKIEAELKMQGFHIDESYEDPAPPI